MSLIWNNKISISYFGEAHDPTIGITIGGLPAGEYINSDEIRKFLDRLSPKCLGRNLKLPMPKVMSGLNNERTTGAPLCAIMQNCKVEKDNSPALPVNLRAGRADYTGAGRCLGFCDVAKKSRDPERFAIPLCFAGAVCGQILERRGIYTGAHISKIHNIKDNPFDNVRVTREDILNIRCKDLPVINDRKGWLMVEDIARAEKAGESLGGIVECVSVNVPAGIGSPVFDGLSNNIAQIIFGLPDIKGIEFGSGFSASGMIGSQYSDRSYITDHGFSMTKTNCHGGMVGGISSGMPITFNAAFKPPETGGGKVCSVPEAVVYTESAVNIAILCNMIDYPNFC